jgi:hypothetical protein
LFLYLGWDYERHLGVGGQKIVKEVVVEAIQFVNKVLDASEGVLFISFLDFVNFTGVTIYVVHETACESRAHIQESNGVKQ